MLQLTGDLVLSLFPHSGPRTLERRDFVMQWSEIRSKGSLRRFKVFLASVESPWTPLSVWALCYLRLSFAFHSTKEKERSLGNLLRYLTFFRSSILFLRICDQILLFETTSSTRFLPFVLLSISVWTLTKFRKYLSNLNILDISFSIPNTNFSCKKKNCPTLIHRRAVVLPS